MSNKAVKALVTPYLIILLLLMSNKTNLPQSTKCNASQ